MLVKRVNSHPGSKVAQCFCYPELLTQHCKHAFARCDWRIYTNKHMAFLPHLQPDPLYIYSPNLAPATPPSKKHTFCTRSSRQQEHDHSHFTSWGRKPGTVSPEKKSGQLRASHTLCTSKNVRWFVGSSPSHLHFLQQTFDCD